MAITSVIKYEGSNDILIWKHPCEDFNTSSEIIVAPSQDAIVVKNGEWQLYKGGGKYIIDNEILPGVNKIVGLITGGVSPNHYQVYFVNKVSAMNADWGTSQPWKIQDPELQVPFNLRASGTYFVKVDDSLKFIQNLIGTTTSFTTKTLNDYFRGILIQNVKSLISKFITEKRLMFTQINANLIDLSLSIQNNVNELFKKRGLQIDDFSISNLDIVEDEIYVEARKAMLTRIKNEVEGLSEERRKQFEVLLAQAANPGSGNMAAPMTGLAMAAGFSPVIGGMTREIAQEVMQTMPSGSAVQKDSQQKDLFNRGVDKHSQIVNDIGTTDIFINCSNCGKRISALSRACKYCGTKLTGIMDKKACPHCGNLIDSDSIYCSYCAEKVNMED